jgi:hypothetical protein
LDVVTNFNEDYPGHNKFNKIQLHNEDLSEVDGSCILVFFGGMSQAEIVVTQDVAAFNVLNGGRPCWLYSKMGGKSKSHLAPLFGRSKVPFEIVNYMLEWQLPKRLYSVGVSVSPTFSKAMYKLAWQSYMQDRYNANTRKLSCKVNLRGLPIGADLMNRFFWYENSIWILEKITNYSLTTFDDAECEFVQVRNRENYTNGQYKLM